MLAATVAQPDKTSVVIAKIWIIAALCLFPWLHGAELVWEQLSLTAFLLIPGVLTLTRSRPLRAQFGEAYGFSLLFGLWLLYCLIYIIPLPLELIARLSEHTAYWYQLKPVPELTYLSLYKQASVIELIKYLALLSLFISLFIVFCSINALRNLVYAMIVTCTLTTVYSLVNFNTLGKFEWVGAIPPWDLSWEKGIRGTFSYKNQYALYLVMTVAMACGILFDKIIAYKNRQAATIQEQGRLTPYFNAPVILLGAAIILIYVTLLNTNSRGPLVSLIIAAVITLALYVVRDKPSRKKLFTKRGVGTGIFLIFAAGAIFTQTSAYDRFSNYQLQDNGRALLRQTAISVVKDFPLYGTGPGTYPYVQHIYKPADLGNSAMSKRAHNDYLETLATHGIIGSVILFSALAYGLYKVFKPVPGRHSGLLLGCRCALLAYLIQSSFDVNISAFYLPVYFITILAVGWVLTLHKDPLSSTERKQKYSPLIKDKTLACVHQ